MPAPRHSEIGSPRSPVDQGEPGVSLTQAPRLTGAQGGVTLGLEQGELDFSHLGTRRQLTSTE